MQFAIHNLTVIPYKDCLVHVDDAEFYSGYSVFESLRVTGGKVLHPEPHLIRLRHSAEILGISCPYADEQFFKAFDALIHHNQLLEAGIRLMLVGGDKPQVYIFSFPPLIYSKAQYHDGVKVVSFKGERSFPEAKTHCLLINYMAKKAAKTANAFEALLENRQGQLLEGSRTNLYALKEKEIFTASEDILNGVTRQRILKICQAAGYTIQYTKISKVDAEKHFYDTLFLSSTSMGAMPISQLNEARQSVEQDFIEFLNSELERQNF